MTEVIRRHLRRIPPKAVVLGFILAALPVVVGFCDGGGRHGAW